MKDHPRFTVLIFLVFATSFNRGERINDLIAKFNERRAAGILAQPRIGRSAGMRIFGRPDGFAGLMQYPRVGRAGPPALADDMKYPEFDGDVKNHREGLDSPVDVDDQKNFDDDLLRRLGNGIWLDNPRYGPRKNQQRSQCENEMDSAGIFIVTPEDYQKMERQLLHYYPRSSEDHSR
ncbi:CAPA peptides isoform X2 [Diachasma alloeum]|uniref:CAPA peptides isoform X2 n=1 Tax=Diachasma alloeum TaxID=454923 RepID=UPI0007383787|nr:CAPA peptides isoform X2 [Diachasma alloeum]